MLNKCFLTLSYGYGKIKYLQIGSITNMLTGMSLPIIARCSFQHKVYYEKTHDRNRLTNITYAILWITCFSHFFYKPFFHRACATRFENTKSLIKAVCSSKIFSQYSYVENELFVPPSEGFFTDD